MAKLKAGDWPAPASLLDAVAESAVVFLGVGLSVNAGGCKKALSALVTLALRPLDMSDDRIRRICAEPGDEVVCLAGEIRLLLDSPAEKGDVLAAKLRLFSLAAASEMSSRFKLRSTSAARSIFR